MRWDEFNSPKLMFFNTCYNALRTIPALIHDDHKQEDLNSSGEDHAADPVRYLLSSIHESKPIDVIKDEYTGATRPMNEVEKKLQEIRREGDHLDLNSFYMGDDYRDSFGVEETE
jgi:maltooligosyltrehalose synthase